MNIRDLKLLHRGNVFFGWWARELRSLVPRAVEEWFVSDVTRIVVRVDERLAQVIACSSNETEVLGEYSLNGDVSEEFLRLGELIKRRVPEQTKVEIELSEDQLLRHQILLPLAVEPTLNEVLRFEMDRLTPFNATQIGYTWRLIERIVERDKLKVELVIVKRDYLSQLLARGTQLGLSVGAVYPTATGGEAKERALYNSDRPRENLLPDSLQAASEALWSPSNKRLLIAALLLFSTIIIYPISRQNGLIEELETEIDLISGAAQVAGEKQRLLAAYLDGYELVVSKKNKGPAKIEIIKRLTEYLPNNTWVSRLVADGESVLLKGESLKSSGLIETLDEAEIFENVEFVSPVIRNSTTNLDRYEIRLRLTEVSK
jgi:general secretion pathway protein L